MSKHKQLGRKVQGRIVMSVEERIGLPMPSIGPVVAVGAYPREPHLSPPTAVKPIVIPPRLAGSKFMRLAFLPSAWAIAFAAARAELEMRDFVRRQQDKAVPPTSAKNAAESVRYNVNVALQFDLDTAIPTILSFLLG